MLGFGRGRPYRDPEIAPDEIFLDSSNLPAFDQSKLEGRLEQPIANRTYLGLGGILSLVLIVLAGQAWNLEIRQGVAYAEKSEKNILRPDTIFAERGAIVDRNGTVLVTNVKADPASTTNAAFDRRTYTTPGFSALLGYVSYPKKDTSGNYYDTEITGLAGVEKAFNDQLAGQNGSLLTEEDSQGHTISQGNSLAPVNGETIKLSIDARVQKALYDAIQTTADSVPFQSGAGILMNAQTGEILALASYPEYDSNVLSSGGPESVIQGYQNDPRQPYLNRPVQGLYTPGSIVKPLEASGALTDGVITPEYTIDDTGSISIPNPYDPTHPNVFKDWKAIGVEDLRRAIAMSSDVYFYTVGGGYGNQKGLGIDRLDYWFSTFGLTSPTGIELPGEQSGFLPTPAWKQQRFNESWNIGDTYHTAIGQYSVQVTPLEMARAIAAVANGGKLVKPTVLADQASSSGGETLAVSPSALEVVREGMRLGVQEGTSVGLNDLQSFVQPAGKTGTAQLGVHNEFYNAWAIGFWPYNNPKYVYVVVMEKGPAGNSTGGIFVMHQFLSTLHSTAPEYFQ